MDHQEMPVTMAVRVLRQNQVKFLPHFYAYEEHGGTKVASLALGIDEHAVIKTLAFETDARENLLVLMHGDLEVSSKGLARTLGVRQLSPCDIPTAERLTGYKVGGISPFGTRVKFRVLAERTIFALPKIWINGGKRGFLVEIDPVELKRLLDVEEVEAGIPRG